jgi:hypothetical protein
MAARAPSEPTSPLAAHEPVRSNDVSAVTAALDGGLSVHSPDAAGWNLIHVAARSNAIEAATVLLARACAARATSAEHALTALARV